MHIDKVLAALDSDLRREILKAIARKPSTALEVFENLKRKGLEIKYRETVYRALEKLIAVGLVQKYYDIDRGLCYKAIVSRLIVDLVQGTISYEMLE